MDAGHGPTWIAIVAALLSSGAAQAQAPVSQLQGCLTLSTGYWRRGLVHIDGASLQLGIDYQHHLCGARSGAP